ncbi:MAS20-domain-containing protein [Cylindrobasidium torrendii FP15055 ss-10]|uniref:MAS20-domain-containing protein n=1 Tax=Cylindrobasidium torrendii FP15055 ss-10 TaxID=1314674 RepID=A0A0D7BU28_9AGAR|nr:MAS20-domain-containing protein [Cylindrobasidium torrendii FP15055 ss-10]
MSSRVLTVAGVAFAGILAYAVYFDYKRRNDTSFRKKLRKDKKRVEKIATVEAEEESAASAVSPADLREAYLRVKKEEAPAGPSERENYFMSQVSMGEQLAMQGPIFYLPASLAFFRALRVYPAPLELMVIYEKTVPEPIFKLIVQLMDMDVSAADDNTVDDIETSPVRPPSETSSQEWDKNSAKIRGYYDVFPPEGKFKVAIESKGDRKVVVLKEDVQQGQTIYKEWPVVATLDPDLAAAGTHCSHCLRLIESDLALRTPGDLIDATYCSKTCQIESKSDYHNLLFTTERPLPEPIPIAPPTPEAMEKRARVEAEYAAHLKKVNRNDRYLAGRFVARQISMETVRLASGIDAKPPKFTHSSGDDYGLGDHMERLRFIEVEISPEDTTLLGNVLGAAMPDLNKFVNDERMAILIGKLAYNSFGVTYGGGRSDRPKFADRPEDQERTRTPYGTARQIGSAFYTLSAYLPHSCSPSARPSFSSGTSELHLIAARDLKKGDELTISYVDPTLHEDETVEDGRRRRRAELARGWKFACSCERCVSEAPEGASIGGVDASKVEAHVAAQI